MNKIANYTSLFDLYQTKDNDFYLKLISFSAVNLSEAMHDLNLAI